MALPDLCTPDDVAAILQRPLSSLEVTYVSRLITQASAIVRRYTRQTITQVVNDVVTLPGNWGNTLPLPQRPVTSVSSVVINNVTAPSTQWTLTDDTLFLGTGAYQPDFGVLLWGGNALWGPAGSNTGPQATGATWQGPQAQIAVTYTHGFDEVPGDIVNVVAGLVALAVASPVGVNMEQIGSYKAQYTRSEGGAMSLQDGDKVALAVYRKRAVSSSIAPLR